MDAAENKKVVADMFAARSRGQGGFLDLLADDVHWTVIGNTAVSRAYKSKKEFIEGAVKPLGEKIGGTIQPKLRDIIADGDRIVLQWDGTATGKNGTAYHQTYCWVMRLENGKVKEGTAYLDTELISKLWR